MRQALPPGTGEVDRQRQLEVRWGVGLPPTSRGWRRRDASPLGGKSFVEHLQRRPQRFQPHLAASAGAEMFLAVQGLTVLAREAEVDEPLLVVVSGRSGEAMRWSTPAPMEKIAVWFGSEASWGGGCLHSIA